MRPAAVARLGTGPGVYRFRDDRGRVLYLGRAVNLRRRVGSYWGDLRERQHLRRMVAGIARVEAVECDSEHEAAWLERNLLERSLPRWNRSAGGQETPVYIRLGNNGLTVSYTGGSECFGPYLGSARTRVAISALHRVLPLGPPNGRLTSTGRDLARARGVTDSDRATAGRTLAAVLDREPSALAALHGELARRRDAAASTLAFEHAARLQDEIEAIDWVCAPQNVTRSEPTTLTVCGWADGITVRFEIRDGRMSGWSQRAGAQPGDAAATPPRWIPFAQRNAELAARLAKP